MKNPKHSIIIPAYNTGNAIRKCVDSIIAQSYTDWELIIVDDGSKDETPAIIDDYAQRDPRIHAIHIPNGGVSNARNVGLDHAQGEYVMFVDSDDWIEHDYLQQVETRMNDDADMYIVGCTQDYTNADGAVCYSSIKGAPVHRVIKSNSIKDEIGYLLNTINMESCWSKSFRRDFLNQYSIRFHKEMIVFEDYYLVLQCLLYKSTISLIPFIGYHYITDLSYNPVARRGFRNLYPSISQLFVMFDKLDKTLALDGYSHEQAMQIMTNKISVVLSQSVYANKLSDKVKPFKQIACDQTLLNNRADVVRHAGGRRRLQFKFMRLRMYYISYLLYKYL